MSDTTPEIQEVQIRENLHINIPLKKKKKKNTLQFCQLYLNKVGFFFKLAFEVNAFPGG